MSSFYTFLSGAAMMGAFACGLFFLRFWQKTLDRLFLIFSIAFFLMGLERIALTWRGEFGGEESVLIYLIRLASFLMILYGIWDKNRPATKE
jgi:hypothetical protein